MEPTDQQREQFAAALAERMKAAGMSQQKVADALAAMGHEVSGTAVGFWRKGQYAPNNWPLVKALDDVLAAQGELAAILGEPDAGLVERVGRLEARYEETVKLTDEMRTLADELRSLLAELRQAP